MSVAYAPTATAPMTRATGIPAGLVLSLMVLAGLAAFAGVAIQSPAIVIAMGFVTVALSLYLGVTAFTATEE